MLLEAIDPLLLVMQRTEGAVLAPPPEHQIRGLLIQTIKPLHAFLYEADHHITSHHTRRRTEKCNAELLLMVALFICCAVDINQAADNMYKKNVDLGYNVISSQTVSRPHFPSFCSVDGQFDYIRHMKRHLH